MKKTNRLVAALLVLCLGSASLPRDVSAAMLATETTLPADRDRIGALLEREDVRAKLEAYGVTSADAKARVSALTDEEAALVAARIDELPAGGVLGLILTIFLVLLITDLLGLTKVFPFTKPVCDRGRC
jgi:hypothetical protein